MSSTPSPKKFQTFINSLPDTVKILLITTVGCIVATLLTMTIISHQLLKEKFIYFLINHPLTVNVGVPIITIAITILVKVLSKNNDNKPIVTTQDLAFGLDLYVVAIFTLITKITATHSKVENLSIEKVFIKIFRNSDNLSIQSFIRNINTNQEIYETTDYLKIINDNYKPPESDKYIAELMSNYDTLEKLNRVYSILPWYFLLLIILGIVLALHIRYNGWETNTDNLKIQTIIIQNIVGFIILFLVGIGAFGV